MKKKITLNKIILVAIVLSVCLVLTGCSEENLDLPEGNGNVGDVSVVQKSIEKVDSIAEKYHDKYAIYYSSDDYQALLQDIKGNYKGIGVYIFENANNGRTTVMSAMKGSPAEKAGLFPGDEILKVNGEDVTSKSSEYVSNLFKDSPLGTEIEIVLFRSGEGEITKKIKVDNVEYPTADSVMIDENDGIGLIKIASFNMATSSQVQSEYDELVSQGMKALVLDLRDNGGGEITSALRIADMFTEKGSNLMYIVSADGVFRQSAEQEQIKIPLVVLQNANTASASEILIGALRDNGVAKTIGTLSFGKGIVQTTIPLESGSGFRYTKFRYLTAGGNEVQGIGLNPDIEFAQPENIDKFASFYMDPQEDPQLAKAVEEVKKQLQ